MILSTLLLTAVSATSYLLEKYEKGTFPQFNDTTVLMEFIFFSGSFENGKKEHSHKAWFDYREAHALIEGDAEVKEIYSSKHVMETLEEYVKQVWLDKSKKTMKIFLSLSHPCIPREKSWTLIPDSIGSL